MTSAITSRPRHRGPSPGFVASIYAVLFLTGLYPVTRLGGTPPFPAPYQSLTAIANFFTLRSSAVLLCAALQFGAAIPLGIYTATMVSRLRFLGVRAAGADIALFGGFLTSFMMMLSGSILWAMSNPGIATDSALLRALYQIQYALGGPGFSIPFGLLVAGLSVTAAFRGLLPKWVIVSGLVIALIGELSWFDILFPKLIVLIPLTRFPGFIWLIVAGFSLPAANPKDPVRGLPGETHGLAA